MKNWSEAQNSELDWLIFMILNCQMSWDNFIIDDLCVKFKFFKVDDAKFSKNNFNLHFMFRLLRFQSLEILVINCKNWHFWIRNHVVVASKQSDVLVQYF